MPTYEYECEACGARHEEFQRMSDKPLKKCPACQKNKLVRLIGAGAGIIFKGSGFYETDYKRGAKPAEKTGATDKPATETKPAATPAPASSGGSGTSTGATSGSGGGAAS